MVNIQIGLVLLFLRIILILSEIKEEYISIEQQHIILSTTFNNLIIQIAIMI